MDLSRSRRAVVQPRFLLAMTAMASALGGVSYLASAQSGQPPIKMKPTPSKPASMMDLPALIKRAGALGRVPKAVAKAGRAAQSVRTGNNVSGFNLDDFDLTPNSPSDEREPVYSPGGGLIAFRSNGRDSNGDGRIDSLNSTGKYHIWVMNSSDGTAQRQLTGLSTADANRNQRRPSWSPDGNQLVYVDGDGVTAQLFVINALETSPTPEQRTFFAGAKQAPAWSPSGLVITFASNANLDGDSAAVAGQFDLFSIDPGGDQGTVQRVTGGTIDSGGNTVDDLNPAYSVLDGSIYFSSNRVADTDGSSVKIAGRRIWRSNGGSPVVVTDPSQRAGFKSSDTILDDFPALSVARNFAPIDPSTGLPNTSTPNFRNINVTEQLAFQTNSRLNASDTNLDKNIWGLPTSAVTEKPANPDPENPPPPVAFILTNSLSSPSTAQSGVTNGGEDFAPDQEPTFNRAVSSPEEVSTFAFASQRRVVANPAFTTQNPNGGNGATSTNDIFSTRTVDTTLPALLPQSIGNQEFPVVSPLATLAGQGQGNPRTREAGLIPNAEAGTAGSLKIAVVIREQESGLELHGSVRAVIRDANQLLIAGGKVAGQDTGVPSPINESILVGTAIETGRQQTNSYDLTAVDDGVHEKQAGAVAGDGIYYCSADVKTPASGEYYIDIEVTDKRLNSLTYDNIWGFSTQAFAKRRTDLLVSDYAVGQLFVNTVSNAASDGGDDGRFVNMLPVESYYIQANGPSGNLGRGTTTDTPPLPFNRSSPNIFPNADVYRILCRGPVTAALLNAYRPSTVTQIDPAETSFKAGQPLTAKTRKVAVASSSVTWASPYAGLIYPGVATLTDTATQNLLTDFSNAGGRLFVMGRDIGFGLTSGGTVPNNSFMSTVLGAKWGGDVPTATNGQILMGAPGLVITAEPGGFIEDLFAYGTANITQELRNLQVPFHFEKKDKPTDNWDDASSNLDPNTTAVTSAGNGGVIIGDGGIQAVGVQPDAIVATNPGPRTQAAYSIGGRSIGQRYSRLVGTIESRSVVFGFGLESINRRYRKPTDTFGVIALDARYHIVEGINSYLKTGSITGTVINSRTNSPIPNFLVRITKETDAKVIYLVRTDANGRYNVTGLDEEIGNGYRVDPAIINSSTGKLLPIGTLPGARVNGGTAQTSPSGFFAGTPNRNVAVTGGSPLSGGESSNANLRPIPILPGSLRGRVVTTDPANSAKRIPANGLFVLVRSKQEDSIFTGGGQYASVAKADATGNFSFSNVPSLIDLEVILNPALTDIPLKSGLRTNFTALNSAGMFQQTSLTTRTITGLTRPGTSTSSVLQVPNNGTFVLNDSNPDAAADSGTPLLLGRFSATLTGKVTVNNAAAPDVSVQLFNSSGVAVSPSVTATTNSAGNYTFSNVSAGSYFVRATTRLGGTGSSAVFQVTNSAGTASANVTVRTININAPLLSGKVSLKLIGSSTTTSALSDATVELLNSSGGSFSPTITTTTDSAGRYAFVVTTNGTYRVRASAELNGTTSASPTSATIKAAASMTAPELFITRFQISGRVVSSSGGAQSRAIVELAQGTNTLSSITATTGGTFVFTNLLPGSYTINAFASVNAGSATGSAPVLIRSTDISVGAVTVRLTGTSTTGPTSPGTGGNTGNGTGANGGGSVSKTFAANSTIAISLPYAIDNTQGTLTVNQAFATTLASGGYKLYYFNAAGQVNKLSQDFVEITSGTTKLVRGQGYKLVTGASPVTIQTPTQNTSLKSYAGTTFSIPLTWNTSFLSNTSEPNNRNNGYNMVGFPFNPATYSRVAFSTSQVIYGSTTYESIDAAAAAGIIDRQLYTLDSSGARIPVDFANRTLTPFNGYFVHILRKDQPVTLVLRNPA